MQKFKTAPSSKDEHFDLPDLGIDYTHMLQEKVDQKGLHEKKTCFEIYEY